MPKVSAQYLADRRAHILDAARTCFLRQGFHATSMQDVFAQSGLSAGAVYRYFASKDQMILAIAEDNMHDITTMIGQRIAAGGESLGEILAGVLEIVRDKHEQRGVGSLALQVWSESVRNPDLRARFALRLTEIRARLLDVVLDQHRAGALPADADPRAIAAVLGSVMPGFMMQLALGGPDAVEGVTDGLRALWPVRADAGRD